jgi:hypothetical protein
LLRLGVLRHPIAEQSGSMNGETTMQVNRVYIHREFDRIGHAELRAPDGKWTLDGKELPAASIEHLLNFALQTLQDAYAGAKSADEATANWEKKRAKLYDGTIGTRGGNAGEEPWTRFVREIVRKLLTGENAAKYAAMKGETDARKDFVDELFAKQPEAARAKIEAMAKEMLAEELKKKAENAKMTKGLGIEL